MDNTLLITGYGDRPGCNRETTGENGFSLIEVMIGMLVLVIGVLAVCSMQLSGIQGDSTGRQYTEASAIAVAQVEALMLLSYDHADLTDTNGNGAVGDKGLTGTGATADHSRTDASGQYTISWNVAEDDVVGNTKTVSVIVGWRGVGAGRTVAMRQVVPEII